MTFRVGQKVVCVSDGSDDPRPWAPGADPLVLGRIYTIESFLQRRDGDGMNLLLVESRNIHPDGRNMGYRASRFRPAVETNIQQFRDLVAPIFAGKKVSA